MESLTRLALRFPKSVLALVLVGTLFAILGVPRSTTEVGYRAIVGDDHPAIQKFDRLIADFNGGLPVIAVWGCGDGSPCDTVYDESAIWMAHAVEQELSQHPLVLRIETPVSTGVLLQTEDGLSIRQFVEGGKIPDDVEVLAREEHSDRTWHGILVSEDARVGAIVVQLDSTDSETAARIVPALREALAPHEARGFEFHLVGDPVDFAVAGSELQAEAPRLIPIMVALIVATVFLLTRSFTTSLLALATSGLAVLWARGAMGWLAWPEAGISQVLAPAVLVIGLCDAIHILSRYATRLARRPQTTLEERAGEMLAVAREIGPACLITTLTTAAAFLSFATSNLSTFVHFGVVAAGGVTAALLLSFTILPVALIRLDPSRVQTPRTDPSWDEGLKLIVQAVRRQHVTILWVGGALALVGLIGMANLRIDVDKRELLGENSRVVRWAEYVEDNLREPDNLEIALNLPMGQPATEPEVIERVDAITHQLTAIDGLDRTISYLNFLSTMNRLLHDGDTAWEHPAESRAANAQLLLAMEMDFDPLINDWISSDRRHLRISVQVENLSTAGRRRVLNTVSDYLEETLPPGWDVTITGPLVVYTELGEEVQATLLRSFATAAFIITLFFYLYLRATGSSIASSTKWTFIGLGPSLLPIVLTLGSMGLLDVPMEAGTAMIAAILLGVAVDDSFHVVTAYRNERKQGLEPGIAMSTAIRKVGRALVTTSFALAAGFMSLTLSSWQSVASFGFLAGIAIIGALGADLLLLPSIVLTLAKADGAPAEPVAPSRVLRPRTRRILTATLSLIVAGVLGLALTSAVGEGETRRLSCWVYPNQVVAFTSAADSACPLQAQDRVTYLEADGRRFRPHSPELLSAALAAESGTSIRARVERGLGHQWLELPILIESAEERGARFTMAALLSFAMLGLGLFLIWSSSSAATVPYAFLYTALCILAIYLLCSPSNELPPLPFVAAIALLPPILLHLALTFPYQRAIVRRTPGVLYFIYSISILQFGAALYGFVEYPALWRGVSAVSMVSIFTAWSMLVVSCSVARRDAVSELERARANSAFWGMLMVPCAVAITMYASWFDNVRVAAIGSLLCPLPIGYAMTRYQLYDARPHARQLAFSIAYSLAYAAILTLGWLLVVNTGFPALQSSIGSQIGLIFMALLTAELLRNRGWSFVRKHIPTLAAHLRDFEEETTRNLRRLNSEEDSARLLAEAVQLSLGTSGVTVFVQGERGWRIAAACGERPSELAEVEPYLDPLRLDEAPVHLSLEGGATGHAADSLREQQIAIVAPLSCRGELLGLVIVKEAGDRMPYTISEVEFVERLCSQSAVAIHNARLSAELLRVERYSTIGRIATGLMHDIGKPMSIVWQRAKKMARDRDLPNEVRDVASVIETMTDDALNSIDRLMDHAREGLTSPVAEVAAGQVIERAVDAVSRIHDRRKVCIRLAPDLPRITGSDELHLALVNLLDNALLASDPDELTDVFATADARRLTIQIIDRGCGMSPEVRRHAFEPFFTTRSGEGGSGIGLAASRTTIERLGGTVALESEENVGTTVTISLVLDDPAEESDLESPRT